MNHLRMLTPKLDVHVKTLESIKDTMKRKRSAVEALRENYNELMPRWKGVVLTAEAELEALEKDNGADDGNARSLPWADMKFDSHVNQFKKLVSDADIPAIGRHMSHADMAQYKYQIDIGGGGGTTWSGTVQKLAVPGLLFHHLTPTKDYVHDRMVPWVHYVPVRSDLSDLREKYDWAEAHPKAAEMIALRGTELMRHIGTVEGFGEMFQEDFADPLRRVVEAYQPVSATHPSETSWRDVIKNADDLPGIYVHEKCSGRGSGKGGCQMLGDVSL